MDEIKKSVEKVGSTVSGKIDEVSETTFVKESKEKVKPFKLLLNVSIYKKI
jgi:hypothetical protein